MNDRAGVGNPEKICNIHYVSRDPQPYMLTLLTCPDPYDSGGAVQKDVLRDAKTVCHSTDHLSSLKIDSSETDSHLEIKNAIKTVKKNTQELASSKVDSRAFMSGAFVYRSYFINFFPLFVDQF